MMNSQELAASDAAESPARFNNLSRRFPRPGDDSILVCPVGGVGQIGMNWTLYGHAGRWVLVDAGSAFAPRDVEGVEAIFPSPVSLRAVLPNLDALIVTHAHEDHIGAIHRIWPGLKIPIHATPFAASILSGRFREANTLGRTSIKVFKPGDTLRIGAFSIKTIRMTHSVPECVALAFSTPAGTVLHTGDWKLDPNPVVGRPSDLEALAALGKSGVLGMVCDSTNADRFGEITSEADVAKGMEMVFSRSRGMVVVSCFSTNVARLATIARTAAATGRQIALAGRSLIRTEQAARECGLLDGVPEFLHDVRHLRGLDRREMALICTGSQGEANAALGRLACGDDNRLPAITTGDVVVHSARVIPGNERELDEILSMLEARGATILRGSFEGNPLHVTGHATARELEILYGMVKPRFSIPVHGEAHHLQAHAGIALKAGVRDVAMAGEGDVFRVSRRRIERVAQVKVELLAVLKGELGSRAAPRFAHWNPLTQEAVAWDKHSGAGRRKRPDAHRSPLAVPLVA